MSRRIRTIKPEMLDDAKTAGLDDHTWRLFVSCILLADDFGCFRAQSIKQLEGAIFWAIDTSTAETMQSLCKLTATGLLTLYAVHNQRYAKVTAWEKHQRINRPGKQRIPRPDHQDARLFTDVALFFLPLVGELQEKILTDLDQGSGSGTGDPDRAAGAAQGGVASQNVDMQQPLSLELVRPIWNAEEAIQRAYESYPRKRERQVGHTRLLSQIKTPADGAALLRAVQNYAATVVGKEADRIKLWPTFANQVWRDYVDMPVEPTRAANRVSSEQLMALADHVEEHGS